MTEKFKNPILKAGADPFVVFWQDKYYYVYSNADASVEVSVADNIHHITREGKCVWKPEEGKEYSKHLWAPEIHIIDGVWYIYTSTHEKDTKAHKHLIVLKAKSDDPFDGFEIFGHITPDRLIIDPTVYNDKKNGRLWTFRFLLSGSSVIQCHKATAEKQATHNIAEPVDTGKQPADNHKCDERSCRNAHGFSEQRTLNPRLELHDGGGHHA